MIDKNNEHMVLLRLKARHTAKSVPRIVRDWIIVIGIGVFGPLALMYYLYEAPFSNFFQNVSEITGNNVSIGENQQVITSQPPGVISLTYSNDFQTEKLLDILERKNVPFEIRTDQENGQDVIVISTERVLDSEEQRKFLEELVRPN